MHTIGGRELQTPMRVPGQTCVRLLYVLLTQPCRQKGEQIASVRHSDGKTGRFFVIYADLYVAVRQIDGFPSSI